MILPNSDIAKLLNIRQKNLVHIWTEYFSPSAAIKLSPGGKSCFAYLQNKNFQNSLCDVQLVISLVSSFYLKVIREQRFPEEISFHLTYNMMS